MGVSFKKLRVILAERKLRMTDIAKNTDLSWGSLTNINKDKYVNLKTLEIICKYLECKIDDILEFTDED